MRQTYNEIIFYEYTNCCMLLQTINDIKLSIILPKILWNSIYNFAILKFLGKMNLVPFMMKRKKIKY